MSTMTPTTAKFVELAHRESDGIEVSLLWNPVPEQLTVFVSDARAGETFEFAVSAENAQDAFAHPFAYAATSTTCSIVSGACELARS